MVKEVEFENQKYQKSPEQFGDFFYKKFNTPLMRVPLSKGEGA